MIIPFDEHDTSIIEHFFMTTIVIIHVYLSKETNKIHYFIPIKFSLSSRHFNKLKFAPNKFSWHFLLLSTFANKTFDQVGHNLSICK